MRRLADGQIVKMPLAEREIAQIASTIMHQAQRLDGLCIYDLHYDLELTLENDGVDSPINLEDVDPAEWLSEYRKILVERGLYSEQNGYASEAEIKAWLQSIGNLKE